VPHHRHHAPLLLKRQEVRCQRIHNLQRHTSITAEVGSFDNGSSFAIRDASQ
jgi:hypothetical protein